MLYFVGLGLGDAKDITLRGLDAVKASSKVFLDMYTSILGISTEELSAFFEKEVIIADREMVESNADLILEDAVDGFVSFLVVGDPFGATTHTDLMLRAKEKGIAVEVIHNASIMNAVGCCGLQLYNFGQTISIPYFTKLFRPYSFLDKLLVNKRNGMHTLCLLDIKVKEISEENLMRGKMIYEPPRFMTVNEALSQIEETIEAKGDECHGLIDANTMVVGLARVGQKTQKIVFGTLTQLKSVDFGGPLHCLVVPGPMHDLETLCLEGFAHKSQE